MPSSRLLWRVLKKAFPAWRATSVMARQQIMFKFTQLVRDNWDRLAASITLEQGKTFAGTVFEESGNFCTNGCKMLRETYFVVYKLLKEPATFLSK
jgi:acyl-CoA reductase-like NAD-dependent aldehyde dehydrogenase